MIALLNGKGLPVRRGDGIAHAMLTIGKTTYYVTARTVPATLAEHGVVAIYSLEGPRGALFYVQDYGPRFAWKAFSLTGAPRALRTLTREHLDALQAMRARVRVLVDVIPGAPFFGSQLVHAQRVYLSVAQADVYLATRQGDDAPTDVQITQATERAQ